MFQKAQECSAGLKKVQAGSRRFTRVQGGSGRFRTTQGGSRRLRKIQDSSRRFKTARHRRLCGTPPSSLMMSAARHSGHSGAWITIDGSHSAGSRRLLSKDELKEHLDAIRRPPPAAHPLTICHTCEGCKRRADTIQGPRVPKRSRFVMSGAGTDACTPPAKPLAKIPASVLLSVTRIDLTDVESPEKLKLAVNAELKENVPPAVKAKPSPLGKTVGLRGTKVSRTRAYGVSFVLVIR